MAEVRITPLRVAQVVLPDFHPEAPGTDTIHGFLVCDPDRNIVVDTGVGLGSTLIERLYQPERADLPALLARAGAPLDRISAVVNSHLHFDHCGNNSLFPDVPIYVQQDELDVARQRGHTAAEWVDFPNANYVPVQGVHPISSNLELIPTPGHTPGHQSLVVRSGSHAEIIAAQAAYTTAEFQLFLTGSIEAPTDAGYANTRNPRAACSSGQAMRSSCRAACGTRCSSPSRARWCTLRRGRAASTDRVPRATDPAITRSRGEGHGEQRIRGV